MGAIKSEAQSRQRRLGITLDLGIYWGWMSLVFFSTALAGIGGVASVELANFVALTVSTVVVGILAFLSPALAQKMAENHLLRATTTLAASTGTLLVLWGSNGDALLIIGACLVGLPEGFLLYLFVNRAIRQCHSAEDVVVLFSWALLIAAALYLTVAFLGTAAGYICAALPLLSLAGLATDAHKSPRRTPRDRMLKRPERGFLLGCRPKAPLEAAAGPRRLRHRLRPNAHFRQQRVCRGVPESYLAHTLARAGTTVVALVLIGKLKKAYWVLSTLQLLAFTLGICSYWLPFESTAALTVAATTAGYTCLELMLWAVLFELFLETNVAFNTLYGIVRGLVSLATLVATGFSLFVMASMPEEIVHMVLLFFLLAMILVSSLLFGSPQCSVALGTRALSHGA